MGSAGDGRAGPERRSDGFTLVELVVVMAILVILAGLTSSVAFVVLRRSRAGVASSDITALEMGLAAYRQHLGAYPPDDVGSGANGMNEALVYHLCRKLTRGMNTYGPFAEIGEDRLRDSEGDGFRELRDPWGNLYQYAENASHSTPTGANPRSYDIVSPGPDGEFGGTISPETGYVPADTPEGKAAEADNVTSWGK